MNKKSSISLKKGLFGAVALLQVLWLASEVRAQSSYGLRSPDRRIEVKVRTGGRVR